MLNLKDKNDIALLLNLKPGNLIRRHDGTWELKHKVGEAQAQGVSLGYFCDRLIKRAAAEFYRVWIVSAEVGKSGTGKHYYLVGFGVEAK